MDDISALEPGERALFEALTARGVRFMLVGLSAAVLQGANTSTRDIDVWFADLSDPNIGAAVREAHGIWITGSFGMSPPRIGGDAIGDRLDVVAHMHGLGTFAEEMANTVVIDLDGVPVRALSLERILASKRAAGRAKDIAAVPALEEALAAVRGRDTREPE
jgi:predicted nucleotidyltransferase